MARRRFFAVMTLGLATVVAGCDSVTTSGHADAAGSSPPTPSGRDPEIPPSTPGASGPTRVLFRGPTAGRKIALTVDDGYNDKVVAGYVAFAVRTGIHLTFSPNGLYAHAWAPHANTLKPLLERGQIQIINHTYSHNWLTRMTDKQIRAELERNEEWVSKTFGVTTRPFYRPPFGAHNPHIDGLAKDLGYTNTVMWNGNYGDSTTVTPRYLLGQARKYLKPGVIMLGHANHPTILGLFNQLEQLIRQRKLNPVTLHEMFGNPTR